ncbi:Protein of unknown function (DUF3153) [Leptolyngbyaceae cyanobacterium JSC-12]|nr:Protein of unknown function (DUF3153) [Leptolyngbyaceae cyanobacterium JSC-12]
MTTCPLIQQFKPFLSAWIEFLAHAALRMRVLILVGLLAIGLMGCVESDVNLRFESPNRGEIIQHIQLSDRFKALNVGSIEQWIKTIERRAAIVGGQVQRTTNEGLLVKIPFTSSAELEQKFNQFFGSVFSQEQPLDGVSLPAIASRLTVKHGNFLLLERNKLWYEVDLRSLGVASSTGDLLVSPASLIKLEFKLETPWGARSVNGVAKLQARYEKQQLVWKLIPGEQNTLESVFWMPSPLGIGAVLILALVLVGQFLKYPRSLNSSSPSTLNNSSPT